VNLATAGFAAFALTLAAGCGTQVDDARIEAVGNGYNAPVVAGGGSGTDTAGVDTTGAVAPGAVADPAAGAVVPGTGQKPAVPGASSAPAAAAGAGAKPGAAAGPAVAAVDPAKAACTKQLSPIVLGQTLATSGLIGSTIGNLRQGVALWAKAINARGGVQCHPVQVISLDDGSDSARVASNWNALKDKGMIAMVGAGEPITIGALRASAERDKIPVVGGDVVALDWQQSQYIFPQGGDSLTAYDGSTIEAAKNTPGAKVAGIIYCVEASVCTDIKNNFPNSARLAGLSVSVTKAVSLTQSDYTAECQAFKDSNTDIVWLALDGSANTRFARSCAQLNYFPQLATSAIGIPPAAASDPALRKNTVYLGGQNVPFPTTDTPGAIEFHAALKQFLPNFTPDGNTMAGWASGKLFEAALAKVAAKARAGDVTTEMVLEGLWQIKNETLNGLSPELTFVKGGTPKLNRCYFTLLLNSEGVTAPIGSKLQCIKEK
jgi:branched-chain amino acid transport system substrate-binding protein